MAKVSVGGDSKGYDKLVDAWVNYTEAAMRRGGQIDDGDSNYWAITTMDNLVRIDPETAWDILQCLIERARDPAVLACIGSGPLEDLLAKHGKDFVDRITARAREDSKFLEVAESVWQNVIPTDVWINLQKTLKEPRK